jgi:hypothetical protein
MHSVRSSATGTLLSKRATGHAFWVRVLEPAFKNNSSTRHYQHAGYGDTSTRRLAICSCAHRPSAQLTWCNIGGSHSCGSHSLCNADAVSTRCRSAGQGPGCCVSVGAPQGGDIPGCILGIAAGPQAVVHVEAWASCWRCNGALGLVAEVLGTACGTSQAARVTLVAVGVLLGLVIALGLVAS